MQRYYRVDFISADPTLQQLTTRPRVWASVLAVAALVRRPVRVFDDVTGGALFDLVVT
jgi:hypothetical protein